MKYLFILEDGEVTQAEKITPDMIESIQKGIATLFKFQDNNFHEVKYDDDGDETESPVPPYQYTQEDEDGDETE